jgi:ABC-2 type transport system ATP-binding protein
VYENLEMFAALWGVPRRKRTKEISFLLELLGLSDYRSTRPVHLSRGALGRLEIARAMVADAPVLIIDSLLDTLERPILEGLWDHLLKLRREESKSVVVFTSFGRIAELCNRMAVIHRGQLVYIGGTDDFKHAAGDDMVVLGDISNAMVRSRIKERMSMEIREEDGFLSFKVTNGERAITDLLSEFGGELGCVYLKRPTLEDALDAITGGRTAYAAETNEGRTG